MINILTIDLEDYFQVHAFSNVIRFEEWDKYESRIERNTDRLLEILYESFRSPNSELRTPVRATFFILGWIAERYPDLIRRIQKEGHEIACHGYAHKLIYNQTKEEFREDIRKAKAILEDIIGDEVIGYRGPSYSITNRSQWALEILMEKGFKYDSSIFPIHHDFYGFPNAPRFPFLISMNGNENCEFSILNLDLRNIPQSAIGIPHSSTPNSELSTLRSRLTAEDGRTPNCLLEFPLSTVRFCGQNLPISGGGYFRLFPYPLIRKGLKNINEHETQPFIFYIHPWEFDFEQPRIDGAGLKSKFRHYINLDKTETKFRKLLGDFQFSTIRDWLEQNRSTAAHANLPPASKLPRGIVS